MTTIHTNVGALTALACIAFVSTAFAQSSVPDQALQSAVSDFCANQQTWLKWFEWGCGVLGVPVGASLLANLRGHLPAPLVKVLDFVAGNWKKAAPIVEAVAQAAAKKTPALLLAVLLGGSLAACGTVDPSTWTPVAAADVEVNAALGVENYLLDYETQNPSLKPLVRTIGQALARSVAAIALDQAAGASAKVTTVDAAVGVVLAAAPNLAQLATAKMKANGSPLTVAEDLAQLLLTEGQYVVPAASAAGAGTTTAAALATDQAMLVGAAAAL